jgi:FkbM family methyltransferase
LRFDPGPSNPAYASGDNELPVQRALARHLRVGDAFFDIGANVGFLSIIGARLVGPTGRVYAFEPVVANASCIRRNAALNGLKNIQVVQKAVGDRTGTAEFMLAAYSGGGALTTAPSPPDATVRTSVEIVSLDDLVAAGITPLPAMVKIDVEGAEMEVLQGMSGVLREHRPVVLCEVDDATQMGLDAKRAACGDFIRAFGYEVTDLEPSYSGEAWLVAHFLGVPGRGV